MQKKLDLLSTLLRDFENDLGTSDLFFVVLKAMKEALQYFKPVDTNDFQRQFRQLVYMFCNTQPKFGLFRHYFQTILYDFENLPKNNVSIDEFFRDELQKIEDQERSNREAILRYSESLDVDGKSILIYEQSHKVQEVLQHLKDKGKKFRIVVAEQEYEKTHRIIEFLHEQNIPFQVVPDYMLSHIEDAVDMLFFGALTLKNTMDFVMPTGSHSVLSEFHTMNIPSYMFLQTTKFSLWESEPKTEVYHKKETRKHFSKPINYERLKFSHDRVQARLFEKIITEEGVCTPEELQQTFEKKLTQCQKQKKVFGDCVV